MTECNQCFRQELHRTFVGTIISIALHNGALQQTIQQLGNESLLTRRILKARGEGDDIMQRITDFNLFQHQHECMLEGRDPTSQWEFPPSQRSVVCNEASDYFGPWWVYSQGLDGKLESYGADQIPEPGEISGTNQSSGLGNTQCLSSHQDKGLLGFGFNGRPEAREVMELSGNSSAPPGAIALDQESQQQVQALVEMGKDWILTGNFPELPADHLFPPLEDPYWSHLHVASERLGEWIGAESQKRSLPVEDEYEENGLMENKRARLDEEEVYWQWDNQPGNPGFE